MKVTCPYCGEEHDVPQAKILAEAASLASKRRTRHGGPTPEQAKAAGRKGALARWNKAKPA